MRTPTYLHTWKIIPQQQETETPHHLPRPWCCSTSPSPVTHLPVDVEEAVKKKEPTISLFPSLEKDWRQVKKALYIIYHLIKN